ncbi:MAG TPA: M3 family metallopeptidase, partial [Acidimicrobiia bacterium]|nr:M3 family metallopeptidase [Acidimicrobiia bacterium]
MTQLDFGFSTVTADKVEHGVDDALATAQEILEQVVAPKDERTFENTMLPLDLISDILAKATTRFVFMGYVHPEKDVRSAAKAAEERMGNFGVEMVFRDDLNAAVQEYAATEEAQGLEGERARFLEFGLRDLRQAGHELEPEARGRVKEMTQRLVELGVRFQENIDEWEDHILVTRDELEGLPPAFAESLETDEETGRLKVTLAYPHMIPFVENAKRRDLREEISFKFNTQAVEANRKILEEAIELRHQIAQEFGVPSWAHHRLEERMAKDPERVSAFYDDLVPPLTKQGETDIAAMAELLSSDT